MFNTDDMQTVHMNLSIWLTILKIIYQPTRAIFLLKTVMIKAIYYIQLHIQLHIQLLHIQLHKIVSDIIFHIHFGYS